MAERAEVETVLISGSAARPLPSTAGERPETLADRLTRGRLRVAEALRYTIGAAEALRRMHGHGCVHGSVHPAGIAIAENQVRLLPCSPVALSPYTSPEQVAGGEPDPRSDVFSLGAVLYEMLSGRPAFQGLSRQAMQMEIASRVPPPLENVPPALARLVERCLESRPERRVQGMAVLVAEIKLLSVSGGSGPTETEMPPRSAEPVQARPAGQAGNSPDTPRTAPGERLEPTIASPNPVIARLYHRAVQCPKCGSKDVRRSRVRGLRDVLAGLYGMAPHRCRSCRKRFFQRPARASKDSPMGS